MATVACTLGPGDAEEVHALYRTYAWWADRDIEGVREALAATDEAVGVRDADAGDLVASARVLTDYAYYAMVFDVIVCGDRRGEGLGRELLAAVVDHPPLDGVTPTLLAREGLVEFYESCGFEATGAIAHPDGDPEPLRFLAYAGDA